MQRYYCEGCGKELSIEACIFELIDKGRTIFLHSLCVWEYSGRISIFNIEEKCGIIIKNEIRTNGAEIYYYRPFSPIKHRESGPAVEYPGGDKFWYINGQRHREDGPATERSSGDKDWCLNGKYYTEQQWHEELKRREKQKK